MRELTEVRRAVFGARVDERMHPGFFEHWFEYAVGHVL